MQTMNDEEIMIIFEEFTEYCQNQPAEGKLSVNVAVHFFEEDFTSLPHSTESVNNMSTVAFFFLKNKRYDELKTIMHRALEFLPEHHDFQFYLALGYYFAGETLVALALGRAVDFDALSSMEEEPCSPQVVCNCPGCTDDPTPDIAFDHLTDTKVSQEVQALFRDIHQFKQIGACDQAIACYEKFFEHIGEPPCLLVDLASLYRKVDNYKDAKKAYTQALEGNPGLYKAHRHLAATHRILDEYELAVGVLKKAHKQFPEDDMILLELAAGYLKLGHTTKAIVSLEKALVIDPSLEFGLVNMPDMEFLLGLVREKKRAESTS